MTVIFRQGDWKIVEYKTELGQTQDGRVKAFHYKLTKKGVDHKFYATAIKWPSLDLPDTETVIKVLKTFII